MHPQQSHPVIMVQHWQEAAVGERKASSHAVFSMGKAINVSNVMDVLSLQGQGCHRQNCSDALGLSVARQAQLLRLGLLNICRSCVCMHP